jgi:hypothetical protein
MTAEEYDSQVGIALDFDVDRQYYLLSIETERDKRTVIIPRPQIHVMMRNFQKIIDLIEKK